MLKGVEVDSELAISDALRHLKAGSTNRLRDPDASPPGIILGARLAEDTGMRVNDNITVVSPEGELTPFGPRPAIRRFKVCAHLRDRLFRYRRHLGVYFHRRRAEGAVASRT